MLEHTTFRPLSGRANIRRPAGRERYI